jgi:hypothetical protein
MTAGLIQMTIDVRRFPFELDAREPSTTTSEGVFEILGVLGVFAVVF